MATEPIENEELNEDSLFDNAVEDTPEETPAVEPAAEVEEPQQAEGAEATSETPAERPEVDDNAPQVPSWRVREINEEKRAAIAERDALRAEMARQQQEFLRQQKPPEPQKQPEEPDPLIDPRGYREFMERRFEERLVGERREMSLQMARRNYKEEFDEAYSTAQKQVDPALRARMQQSSDPGETLIQWYRELKVRSEVGNDLAAYEKKVEEKLLKNPEFRKRFEASLRSEASSQTNGRPNVQLAPSMSGISRSNAAVKASQEDFSDDALWDQTTT